MFKWYTLLVVAVLLTTVILFQRNFKSQSNEAPVAPATQVQEQPLNPLTIIAMRLRSYPGSEFKIEQTLADGINYHQYIVSYYSEGLKIYGLLTVPIGNKPADGWPAIIFNHGYIPPEQYRTTERYVSYVSGFKGAYYSPAYTIDVLNALASVKKMSEVDMNKIGMWGHSLGGNITLRSLVISPDIKAAVIWGGVVGTYDDLMNNWSRRVPYKPSPRELTLRNRSRSDLITRYESPSANPKFWNSIDPNYNLNYIRAPVQLDAGLEDEEVPWQFSEGLKQRLLSAGKTVEFYTYPGADHNISGNSFNLAMQHSLDFFDRYLK